MRLLWTNSNSLMSCIIRLVTGEDCSHFSFAFDSSDKGVVFESNLLGTHPTFLHSTLKTHTIVHELELKLSTEEEDKIWDLVVNKYDGKPYDFGGVLFVGFRFILKRLFNIPMPEVNAWATPGAYYCEEVYDILSQVCSELPKINTAMTTPHGLWEALENA